MKMLKEDELETPEHQELRAQRRLRGKAVIKAALLAGLFAFVVPAGGPWMSNEGFTAAFGRHFMQVAWLDLIAHFVLALVYGWIIGSCIFSLSVPGGILIGAAIFLPLYGLNYGIFAGLGGLKANELHVGLAHFVFCLVFSAAYKAFSIPRLKKWDGAPIRS